jgi:DNA processing protein
MAEHGSAMAALEALPDIATASGAKGYEPCPASMAAAEFARARKLGAQLLCYGDMRYPALLMDIPDPPPLLWALGDTDLLNRPTIALVGARSGSSLGLRMTKALARGLGAAGHVIASGLARGIDTAAHEAALPTGTVAVMAGGIDVIYPPENKDLAQRIAAEGVLISEQPMGLEPQARHFPRRNRIVSGLARAVVVIEAAAKSGSLITARMALDQGREVMAVPGHPFDGRASGCNMLVRDGATLVRGPEDVLAALGENATSAATPPKPAAAQLTEHSAAPPPRPATTDVAGAILNLLGPNPVAEDQLLRDLGVPPQVAAEELLTLELDGRIERRAGGLLALAS